jgi:hypothetical protein
MSEAERIASLFENAPKTVSMLALAVAAGAEISNNGRIRLYSFSDGSRIRVYGRGRSHQYVIDHTALKAPAP